MVFELRAQDGQSHYGDLVVQSLLNELKVVRQEITVIPNDFNGRYDETAETAFRGLLKKCDALLARLEPIVDNSLEIHKQACRELEETHREVARLKEDLDIKVGEKEHELAKREERLLDRERSASYRLAEAESRELATAEELNRVSARAISLGGDYKKRVDEFEVDYKNRCETVSNLLSSELKRLSAKERGLEAQYLSQTKAALANLRSEYDTLFANLEGAVLAKYAGREVALSRKEKTAADLQKELLSYREKVNAQYQERADQLAREFSRKRKQEEHELLSLQDKYNNQFAEIDKERSRLGRVAHDLEVTYSDKFTQLQQLAAKK